MLVSPNLSEVYSILKVDLQSIADRLNIHDTKLTIRKRYGYCTGNNISNGKNDDGIQTTLSVSQILELDLLNDFTKSVFIDGYNCVYEEFVGAKCESCEAEIAYRCANSISKIVGDSKKLLMLGFKDSLFSKLSSLNEMRIIDMSSIHVWEEHSGVVIEHAQHLKDGIVWCDTILISEDTLLNEKLAPVIGQEKPVFFLGNRYRHASKKLGFNHYCLLGTI